MIFTRFARPLTIMAQRPFFYEGHHTIVDVYYSDIRKFLDINPYKVDGKWKYCIEDHDGVPLGWYSSVDNCFKVFRMIDELWDKIKDTSIMSDERKFFMPSDEEMENTQLYKKHKCEVEFYYIETVIDLRGRPFEKHGSYCPKCKREDEVMKYEDSMRKKINEETKE